MDWIETILIILIVVAVVGQIVVNYWSKRRAYMSGQIPHESTVTRMGKTGTTSRHTEYTVGDATISKKEFDEYWSLELASQKSVHSQKKRLMLRKTDEVLSRLDGADLKVYNLAKSLAEDIRMWSPSDDGFLE